MAKTLFWTTFFVLIMIFSTGVLGADFYFKKGNIINLKITCHLNGANCDNTINCNLTSFYPNSSVFVDNKAMTYNAAYFDYTLPATNITGVFNNDMVCYSGNISTFSLFSYEINNRGNNEQPSFMNALLILIPLILGIIFIFATFGIGDDHPVLKIGLLLFSMLTFFMSLSIAIINIGYYNTFDSLIDTLGMWIYVYGTIYFLIIVYFILYAIAKLTSMLHSDKEQKLNY